MYMLDISDLVLVWKTVDFGVRQPVNNHIYTIIPQKMNMAGTKGRTT